MPIFEYACTSCGREFERLVRPSSPAPQCPDCRSEAVRKKLSAFAPLTGGGAAPAMAPAGACGSCGHPGGPGACQFD